MTSLLHVIDPDTGRAVELVLSDAEQELLELQMTRCIAYGGFDAFAQRLSQALGASLLSIVDYTLRPPSEAQTKFAMAIARTLGIPISPDVLRYRGAMHDFIFLHAPAFMAHRKTRTGQSAETAQRFGEPD